jgi:hypothetical protein
MITINRLRRTWRGSSGVFSSRTELTELQAEEVLTHVPDADGSWRGHGPERQCAAAVVAGADVFCICDYSNDYWYRNYGCDYPTSLALVHCRGDFRDRVAGTGNT